MRKSLIIESHFVTARGKEFKMQVYLESKNCQRTEPVELENTRFWLTYVYVGRYFNDFIRGEMKKDILKKVIVNGSTGSSWFFKRFNRLQVNAIDKSKYKNILSS